MEIRNFQSSCGVTGEGTGGTAAALSQPAAGSLTLVGTPIGNLQDLSPRARSALASADTILAEDTRVAHKLLLATGISSDAATGRVPVLERCDEYVMADKIPALLERIQAGEQLVLVSDAGMPAVADPGARLVDAARRAGIEPDVIPGPSALTCAVALAGFAGESFYFGGFLPRKDAARASLLGSMAQLPSLLVFYESPHRIEQTLRCLAQQLPRRPMALLRELTKLHQEVLRGYPADILAEITGRGRIRGELVLVLDQPGKDSSPAADTDTSTAALEDLITQGLEKGIAASRLARDLARETGRSRREIYGLIVQLQDQQQGQE